MRSLAFLLLLAAALAPGRARADEVLWIQPAPMLFAGAPLQETLTHLSLRALSVGANIPVMGKALVVETVITPGTQSSDCGTTWFLGGWAAAGVLLPLSHSPTDGLFLEPKLIGSYFNQTSQGSGCVDATKVNWSTVEWDVGVDVGYQITLGPLYVAPVIGAFVGECYNCTQSTTVLAPYAPYFGKAGERLSRISYGLNLNLLRIGLIF